MDVVRSVNGIPIRLTDERWGHVIERHEILSDLKAEVLQTIQTPFAVLDGSLGELWAIRRWNRLWIVVPYREVSDADGFVITAFVSRTDPSTGRTVLWPST